MPIGELDPDLIRATASAGRAEDQLDAIDAIIAKLNEVVFTVDSGGLGDRQVFRYVATGAEANPFVVSLPEARADADYIVTAQHMGPASTAIKALRPLEATFTTTQFQLECSASPQLNDIFAFTVSSLT